MKTFLSLFSLVLLVQRSHAQQTPQKFTYEMQYLLALPQGYAGDSTQKWPLVMFLHGSGESGTDIEKVKVHGLPKLAAAGKQFPFIVVSPQSDGRGWDPELLNMMITDVKKKYRVDHERVYLTGLSMGGYGTWALAMKHPEQFAAIAPICGGGDTADIWKLRYMPTWNFHGGKDNVVPLSSSDKMVNALRHHNNKVKYTVYPEAGHDSWTVTYDNDSLYTWLLSHKRHTFQPVTVNAKTLAGYAGKYVGPGKDTLTVTALPDGLQANAGRNNVTLKPASDKLFYFDANMPFDVEFVKDGFILRTNDVERFRKLK